MLWPKKIHTRNLITKKNFCDSKIPLPPPPPSITFLMGPYIFWECQISWSRDANRSHDVTIIIIIIIVVVVVSSESLGNDDVDGGENVAKM